MVLTFSYLTFFRGTITPTSFLFVTNLALLPSRFIEMFCGKPLGTFLIIYTCSVCTEIEFEEKNLYRFMKLKPLRLFEWRILGRAWTTVITVSVSCSITTDASCSIPPEKPPKTAPIQFRAVQKPTPIETSKTNFASESDRNASAIRDHLHENV